jgi:hypothetical protein
MVACRAMGFTDGGVMASHTSWGTPYATDPINMDNAYCTGSETSLDTCPGVLIGSHNCHHAEDVAVCCGSAYVHSGHSCTRTGAAIAESNYHYYGYYYYYHYYYESHNEPMPSGGGDDDDTAGSAGAAAGIAGDDDTTSSGGTLAMPSSGAAAGIAGDDDATSSGGTLAMPSGGGDDDDAAPSAAWTENADIACSGRNELPSQTGITIETAKAYCESESTCVSFEQSPTSGNFQFSTSCLPPVAQDSPNWSLFVIDRSGSTTAPGDDDFIHAGDRMHPASLPGAAVLGGQGQQEGIGGSLHPYTGESAPDAEVDGGQMQTCIAMETTVTAACAELAILDLQDDQYFECDRTWESECGDMALPANYASGTTYSEFCPTNACALASGDMHNYVAVNDATWERMHGGLEASPPTNLKAKVTKSQLKAWPKTLKLKSKAKPTNLKAKAKPTNLKGKAAASMSGGEMQTQVMLQRSEGDASGGTLLVSISGGLGCLAVAAVLLVARAQRRRHQYKSLPMEEDLAV